MFYLNSKSMRNVCGLDVHKDNVFVCIDKENGEKIQFKAGVLTKELDALCETLVANDVTEIAMESTSVYRMPIWRVLENDYKMLYQLSYGTCKQKRVTPKNDSFQVVPPGIEPGTQGFSVLCSTN